MSYTESPDLNNAAEKKMTRRKTDCNLQITNGGERGRVGSTAIHGTPVF
jgi:hypothetical protein